MSASPRSALAAAVWLAGGLLACDAPEAPEARPPPAAPVPAPAAPEAPAPLAAGRVTVSFDGERVALRANEAPRSLVLQALAAETGLALDVGRSRLEDSRISAHIEGATPIEVLSLVLRDADFSLDLAFDRSEQRHRIAALRMGTPPHEEGADPLAEAFYEMLDSADSRVVVGALEALERAGDASAVAEIEPLLDDADPEVREAAAAALETLDPGL